MLRLIIVFLHLKYSFNLLIFLFLFLFISSIIDHIYDLNSSRSGY